MTSTISNETMEFSFSDDLITNTNSTTNTNSASANYHREDFSFDYFDQNPVEPKKTLEDYHHIDPEQPSNISKEEFSSLDDEFLAMFQDPIAHSETVDNTICPSTNMNWYMELALNNSQTENTSTLIPHKEEPHNNVQEEENMMNLFEATCKELDEWKSSINLEEFLPELVSSTKHKEVYSKSQSPLQLITPTSINTSALNTGDPWTGLNFDLNPEPATTQHCFPPVPPESSYSSTIEPQHFQHPVITLPERKSIPPTEHKSISSPVPKPITASTKKRKLDSRTTKLDFSHIDVPSIADLSYSAKLANHSPNVPTPAQCRILNEKLIQPYSCSETCHIQRTLYLREDLEVLLKPEFRGEFELSLNQNFKKTSYEAQYILTKFDRYGKPDNTTRAGLCPYCEKVQFFGLKNSSYGNHLAYKHGILTNGASVPDPKYYGKYKFKKGEYEEPEKKKRRTNAHLLEREGVLCTSCWQILEVNCTSRSSVLGHYLRHYRDSHVGNKKETSTTTTSAFSNKYDPNVVQFTSKWKTKY
ncbi:uncharacterized protein SPAPADRAFT_68925 [Spathaspora passalidarum NRRL Y-27907]|uniref:Transcription regulator Rua1 C-terminal domain-containing protein n=1 Tax=Spathaspora passalidarum (strain NRRL Y-27907 / 11-Y1) TaxID=619300 RepID=G3AV25_SPAPN|nr:uncharacterized protein SPAPADRAFT_68925 [Spathaspora passalidarum NRRL Y-27907]EGW30098.1 hypothetical protein SPAPADRAFT_68925 [Spathaspora passalidarum NRRL Y-27907]